jgi:hypothetical protein
VPLELLVFLLRTTLLRWNRLQLSHTAGIYIYILSLAGWVRTYWRFDILFRKRGIDGFCFLKTCVARIISRYIEVDFDTNIASVESLVVRYKQLTHDSTLSTQRQYELKTT